MEYDKLQTNTSNRKGFVVTVFLKSSFVSACVVCLLLSGSGCKPTAPVSTDKAAGHSHDHDHDHGDEVKSMADAWKEIEKFAGEIKKACEADKPDDAHDALHEIGHSLEAMESLTSKELKSDEAKASAKAALKVLFDAFGAIDDGMHGGKGKKYDEVAKEIDDALTTIKKLVSGE